MSDSPASALSAVPSREPVQTWLALQCSMLTGVIQAAVLTNGEDLPVLAEWPRGTGVNPAMSGLGRRALEAQHEVLANDISSAPTRDLLAFPLLVHGRPFGVLVLAMRGRPEAKRRAVLQVLNWGAAWLEVLLGHEAFALQERLETVIGAVTECVQHEDFHTAATAVVTTLARRLSCDRVSIAFLHGRQLRVEAISDSAQLEPRANLVGAITAAMHEALDQDAPIQWPPSSPQHEYLSAAHARLAEEARDGAVCSVPLIRDGRPLGVLSFERRGGQACDGHALALCEPIALLIGPILEDKRALQRGWLARLGGDLRGLLARLFGPGHLALKTGLLAALALVGLLSVLTSEYRIRAHAELEGRIQRVVVAPYAGFIGAAPARPGDVVERGQVLCRLDDRELQSERNKWASEQAGLRKKYREALAGHDRAKIGTLRARLDQAEAELALVDEKLARSTIRAPLAGVVVSGDHSQSLGAPVQRGEQLFEVAPLDGYRIMLDVDEREVAAVRPGQNGRLILSSLPGTPYPFAVERIVPIATTAHGENLFRVEARLRQPAGQLRPGMQGIGKIDAGRRRLIWIWTHGALDWLRLRLWAWL